MGHLWNMDFRPGLKGPLGLPNPTIHSAPMERLLDCTVPDVVAGKARLAVHFRCLWRYPAVKEQLGI